MKKIMRLTKLICLLVSASSCLSAAQLKELRQDSAVIGFTGIFVKLGVSPSPTAGGMPLPSLEAGYGTAWRVGKHDEVTVAIGSNNGIEVNTTGTATSVTATTPLVPKLSSMASLYITAKDLPSNKQSGNVDDVPPTDNTPKDISTKPSETTIVDDLKKMIPGQ